MPVAPVAAIVTSYGSNNQVPEVPLALAADTEAPVAILRVSPEVSIKPPLPLAPKALADKAPATKLPSPQTRTLPPSPLTVLLALRLLLASMVVLADVGRVMTEERLGSSAA